MPLVRFGRGWAYSMAPCCCPCPQVVNGARSRFKLARSAVFSCRPAPLSRRAQNQKRAVTHKKSTPNSHPPTVNMPDLWPWAASAAGFGALALTYVVIMLVIWMFTSAQLRSDRTTDPTLPDTAIGTAALWALLPAAVVGGFAAWKAWSAVNAYDLQLVKRNYLVAETGKAKASGIEAVRTAGARVE